MLIELSNSFCLTDCVVIPSGHDYAAKELQDLCQCTLNDFNLCMFYPPTSWQDTTESTSSGSASYSDEERPLYLDDELIFKIAVMSMMCIHYQRQMSSCS